MWDKISHYFYLLLQATPTTLELTIFGFGLGAVLGLPLAFARVYGGKILSRIVDGYEKTFRSIPLIVLIFMFYFALLPPLFDDPFLSYLSVILPIGLTSSAFQSQIFRSAIEAVSGQQMIAGLSLGMTKLQVMRHIIFPQMFFLALPGWVNEYANQLKDTSWAYTIGIPELMRWADYIRASEQKAGMITSPFDLVLPYLIASIIYFALTYPVSKALSEWGMKKKKLMGYSR